MINVIKDMAKSKIYGVVRADETKRAVEIATAYLDAGIKFVEINSNIEAIKEVAKREDAIVSAGADASFTSMKFIMGLKIASTNCLVVV